MFDIENEIVHQKDTILKFINNDEFELATTLLNFSQELWSKANYGYKLQELRARVRQAVQAKITDGEHHQTVSKWQRLLAKLPQ